MAAGIKASADGLYGTLQVNSADVVTFNDSGNVGIGTLTPTAKLAIYTASGDLSAQVETAGAGQAGLNLYNSTRKFRIIADASASALVFYDQTASAERMRISSGGRFAVGHASPDGKLDVQTGTDEYSVFRSTTTGADIVLKDSGTTLGNVRLRGISNALAFIAGGDERGRFDSSGNFLFNSGYGSVATAYGCRAWVNFNGTGTAVIRDSGNVSSLTDNSTGNYTVNFSTVMPDANYSAVAASTRVAGTPSMGTDALYNLTTASVSCIHGDTGGARVDPVGLYIAIFR